jgi:hypothetical protein
MAIDAWAVYYSEDIAIVSRKPEVKQDEDTRLHSINSPAVKFKDGYEIYYIHGIHFEKELFDKITSKKLTFDEILKECGYNVDQRNQAMRFIGDDEREKWLENIKAEVIDEHIKYTLQGNPVYYKLYKIPQGEIFNQEVKAMWYICPSTGLKNFSGVPSEMKSVAEAMAWKGSNDESILSPQDWLDCVPLLDES